MAKINEIGLFGPGCPRSVSIFVRIKHGFLSWRDVIMSRNRAIAGMTCRTLSNSRNAFEPAIFIIFMTHSTIIYAILLNMSLMHKGNLGGCLRLHNFITCIP